MCSIANFSSCDTLVCNMATRRLPLGWVNWGAPRQTPQAAGSASTVNTTASASPAERSGRRALWPMLPGAAGQSAACAASPRPAASPATSAPSAYTPSQGASTASGPSTWL